MWRGPDKAATRDSHWFPFIILHSSVHTNDHQGSFVPTIYQFTSFEVSPVSLSAFGCQHGRSSSPTWGGYIQLLINTLCFLSRSLSLLFVPALSRCWAMLCVFPREESLGEKEKGRKSFETGKWRLLPFQLRGRPPQIAHTVVIFLLLSWRRKTPTLDSYMLLSTQSQLNCQIR